MRSTYTLVRCIAHSGTGDVFLGEDDQTGRTVAIHVVDVENVDRKSLGSGSKRIAQYSQCRSPHVKAFVSSYVLPRTTKLCIVSEYLDHSMSDVLQASAQPMSEAAVSEAIRVVLAGLRYLHGRSVAHRNVKAASVLLSKSGNVMKLGQPRIFDTLFTWEDGHPVPAELPYWAAPEVLGRRTRPDVPGEEDDGEAGSPYASRGDQEDPSSTSQDIWSVGMTALEMATGGPPPPERPASSLEGGSPVPIPKNLSEAFRDFVSLCLKRDPRRRPTVQDLLDHKFITKPKKGARLSAYVSKLRAQQRILALTPRFGINVPEQSSTHREELRWDFEAKSEKEENVVLGTLDRLSAQMTRSILAGAGALLDEEARQQSSRDVENCFLMLKEVYSGLLSTSDQGKIEQSLVRYVHKHCNDKLNADFKEYFSHGGVKLQAADLDVNRYLRMGAFSRFVIARWKEHPQGGIFSEPASPRY
ncbi:protein kinase [Chloropicon primus]|uniref:Protein kinase n=2 Tax=Chloropicon primus TaxID=1764295 RepID=A0A5B8MCW4_9CHLO|nr:protein kinase [Chloropicon primus]UPQ97576.1 protein kinase [Chloropicon primus]|eukprot:QDZ18366.1 protein kinase [Chloropicon primus]